MTYRCWAVLRQASAGSAVFPPLFRGFIAQIYKLEPFPTLKPYQDAPCVTCKDGRMLHHKSSTHPMIQGSEVAVNELVSILAFLGAGTFAGDLDPSNSDRNVKTLYLLPAWSTGVEIVHAEKQILVCGLTYSLAMFLTISCYATPASRRSASTKLPRPNSDDADAVSTAHEQLTPPLLTTVCSSIINIPRSAVGEFLARSPTTTIIN
ncbi:hypothetical protein ACO22_04919 [Paracoccidioides brasiliensis]|uniref:Uncharacterized protein n=1 Tax=Paracoccidioides brasiliensis TaxID=121759 RepID=A0A1D2JBW1_PARBR|nr:hypothetical protein ACO22_04919 [Paracoccidioides brasiliensis]